jgi:hypothetical protein
MPITKGPFVSDVKTDSMAAAIKDKRTGRQHIEQNSLLRHVASDPEFAVKIFKADSHGQAWLDLHKTLDLHRSLVDSGRWQEFHSSSAQRHVRARV